jgi:hypothetical protein
MTEQPTGPTPEQLAAVNTAQTPEEYAAAAQAAGLTGDAEGLAVAGAAPVQVPDFSELVRQVQADNAKQIADLEASFRAQLDALKAGMPVPAADPRLGVARNLADGLAWLVKSYPNLNRLAPLEKSAGELSAAVALPGPDDAPPEAPDGELVGQVIKTFRRVRAANPQVDTGILEHAAQIAEDTFEL